jgi:hypothetical protein
VAAFRRVLRGRRPAAPEGEAPLQRRWRRSLAGIALLHALGQVPAALAAQIDVGAGGCTLVDAITAANADQPPGGCTTGSGVDTIALPAGSTQTLTRSSLRRL